MLSSGCNVDVCHVIASNEDENDSKLTTRPLKNVNRKSISEKPLKTNNENSIDNNESLMIFRNRTPSELNIDIPKSRSMRRKSSSKLSDNNNNKKRRVRSESSIENYFIRQSL